MTQCFYFIPKEDQIIYNSDGSIYFTFLAGKSCYDWAGTGRYYYRFRKRVLLRDDNTCVLCGETKQLMIHHIKPRKDFPELYYDYDNVITVCKRCHESIHGCVFDHMKPKILKNYNS